MAVLGVALLASFAAWAEVTLSPALTIAVHRAWVFSVDFSPDGKWLVSGSADDTIKLWDLAGID